MYNFINLTGSKIIMESKKGERRVINDTGVKAELHPTYTRNDFYEDYIFVEKGYGHIEEINEEEMDDVLYIVPRDVWENYCGERNDILYLDEETAYTDSNGDKIYKGFIVG